MDKWEPLLTAANCQVAGHLCHKLQGVDAPSRTDDPSGLGLCGCEGLIRIGHPSSTCNMFLAYRPGHGSQQLHDMKPAATGACLCAYTGGYAHTYASCL